MIFVKKIEKTMKHSTKMITSCSIRRVGRRIPWSTQAVSSEPRASIGQPSSGRFDRRKEETEWRQIEWVENQKSEWRQTEWWQTEWVDKEETEWRQSSETDGYTQYKVSG